MPVAAGRAKDRRSRWSHRSSALAHRSNRQGAARYRDRSQGRVGQVAGASPDRFARAVAPRGRMNPKVNRQSNRVGQCRQGSKSRTDNPLTQNSGELGYGAAEDREVQTVESGEESAPSPLRATKEWCGRRVASSRHSWHTRADESRPRQSPDKAAHRVLSQRRPNTAADAGFGHHAGPDVSSRTRTGRCCPNGTGTTTRWNRRRPRLKPYGANTRLRFGHTGSFRPVRLTRTLFPVDTPRSLCALDRRPRRRGRRGA